jgi:hypothetical protein
VPVSYRPAAGTPTEEGRACPVLDTGVRGSTEMFKE